MSLSTQTWRFFSQNCERQSEAWVQAAPAERVPAPAGTQIGTLVSVGSPVPESVPFCVEGPVKVQ